MSDEAMEAIKNAKSSEEIKNAVKKYKLQRKPPLQAFIAKENFLLLCLKKTEKTQQRNSQRLFSTMYGRTGLTLQMS